MNNSRLPLKPYPFNQLMLFPSDIRDLIPENHLVRVVSNFVDNLDLNFLYASYRGGGASAYDPRMLLKVLIYAYSQKTFSSRRIAKAIRENINFIWLTGFSQPDFRTINRFRKKHLGETFEQIFANAVELLINSGYINYSEYFVDGTKIEADANRYSFVWKKSTDKYQASLQKKIKELFQEIQELNDLEDNEYGDGDLAEVGNETQITSEDIKKQVEKLKKQISEKPKKRLCEKDKKRKKVLKKLENDFLVRSQKYEAHQAKFKGRNSFSKTDPDATFMCMKEDHMMNRKLKPGYNYQIGTSNQFIVNYSVHQNPTDTLTLIPHLEKLKKLYGKLPNQTIADAGYGSEENYEYIEKNKIENFVKYNYFDKHTKRSFKREIFRPENLKFNEKLNIFTCPGNKELKEVRAFTRTNKNGFESHYRVYRTDECFKCEYRADCTKARNYREIQINHNLRTHRKKAFKNLTSARGKGLRIRRTIEPETVFANIKRNLGFKRLNLRGLIEANTECGLISMAHNMIKLAKRK